MKAIFTLLVAYVAAALMTTFSYIFSSIRKGKFKEPMLLNELMARLHWIPVHTIAYHPLGWLTHFVVSVLFVAAFEIVKHHTGIDLTFLTLTMAGAIFGVIGIIGWEITFRIHPSPPPDVKLSEYYLQLFIAHIVFGIGMFVGYYLVSVIL
jgi:hypothetical protein